MPKKTARRIIDTKKATGTTILTGVTVSGSPGSGASAAMAGDGLTYDAGVLDVGAGTLITVGADSVGITAGSTYQYVGTGAGTAAAWQNVSTLAGSGLTHSAGVLAVGAGNGITVNADDVALASTVAGNGLTYSSGVVNVAVANTGGTGLTVEADAVRLTTYSDRTGSASGVLYAASGNLKLTTQNISSTLQSNVAFTSGFAGAGWNIDYGSTEAGKASATFDNLTVRGRMRVYELLIQQIRATNGSVLVSSSSKVFTVSADDDPLWTVNGSQLTFNGANATLETTLYTITTSDSTEAGASRTHYHGFLTGDLIRAQQMQWDGSGFAGVIQSDLEVTGVTNLYAYTGARVSTASDAPAVGYDFVRIGSASSTSRQGVVYLTSDDDNAPFIDIVDGVAAHSDWNTAGKIKARLGRLDGITDAQFGTLDGYGLWSDNVYLTGSIYATDGIFNGTVYATAGSFSGTVTASAGNIGGWSIGATALTAGSGATTVGLDTGGTNPAIYAGSATPGSAPFRVTQAGSVTASDISLAGGSISGVLNIGSSGEIRQGSGTLGSNFTGLRLWYDTGVGRIGGYNNNALQWYAGTDGKFYTSDSDGDALRIDAAGVRLRMTSGSETFSNIVWCRPISTADITTDYHGKILSTYVSGTKTAYMQFRTYVNTDTDSSYEARTIIEAQGKVSGSTSGASIEVVRNRTQYYINLNGYQTNFSGYMQHGAFATPSGTPPSGYLLVWFNSSGSNYTLNVKNSSGSVKSVTLS